MTVLMLMKLLIASWKEGRKLFVELNKILMKPRESKNNSMTASILVNCFLLGQMSL